MTTENLSPIDATPKPSLLKRVNWKQVGAFLALTFGLTWGLDLILYLTGGLHNPAALFALQLQMLLPAFSAILLGMFFFSDSPINIKTNRSGSRWFIWYYLVFTLLYIAAVVVLFFQPSLMQSMSSIMLVPSLVGLVLIIVLRATGGKNTFTSVGMGGGNPRLWFLFGLGVVLFMGLQTLLSWLFKMGTPVDLNKIFAAIPPTGLSSQVLLALITFQTIVLGPLLGLIITFGEEYGWRGYLQPALSGLGKVRGVALVGVIWGIWHWPVIWMGYNYPEHPYLGTLLMTLFSMGLAFFLGYAVLKAHGIWIAAFQHALINQTLSFFAAMVYKPTDPALSFGMGIPGLIVLGLVVLLILRDPVWKKSS